MRTLFLIMTVLGILSPAIFSQPSQAAGLRVVGPAGPVVRGQDFSVDIVADDVPAEGLGTIQFRLHVQAANTSVVSATDTSQGSPNAVTVATPLLISAPTASRSGLGDFFWNGRGPNGILVMDNQALQSGSALFTFAHTNGAIFPSGSGTVARFQVRAGGNVSSNEVNFSLTDVALLAGSTSHPVGSVAGTSVTFDCQATVPSLIGLPKGEAEAALAAVNLTTGAVTEFDNASGSYPLNVVLSQSAPAGTVLACHAPVSLVINTPPQDVTALTASDKPYDDSGILILAWTPSPSPDVGGYRVYRGPVQVADLANPAADGAEVISLPIGIPQQFRVTAYDKFGNVSLGVTVTGTSIGDVSPLVTINPVSTPTKADSQVITGVTEVGSVVFVETDTTASDGLATVTGTTWSYTITGLEEGGNGITVTAEDAAGNAATAISSIVLDSTPPDLVISTLPDGAWTSNPTLNIAGTVTDSAGTKGLVINGTAVPIAPDGSFSHACPMQPGANSFSITATDLLDNQAVDTRTINYDPAAPVLTILAPPDNSRTNISHVDVTGTVDENAIVEVKVNANSPDLAAVSDNTFSYTANLDVGPNTIEVIATDLAENSTNAKRSLVYDNLSPSLAITEPLQDITTSQSSITLQGTVADALSAVTITVTIDGQTFTPPVVDGSYEQRLTFTEQKIYAIIVTATDEAGNSTSVQRNVIYAQPTWGSITPPVTLTKSGTLFDSLNNCYYVNISVRNGGPTSLSGPLRLVIISPSIPVKTLPATGLKPTGTKGGETYFDIVSAGETLAAGATLGNQRVNFNMVRVPLTLGMRVDQLK